MRNNLLLIVQFILLNFFFQFLSEYRTTGQTKSLHFSLLSLYPFSQSSNFKGKVFFIEACHITNQHY